MGTVTAAEREALPSGDARQWWGSRPEGAVFQAGCWGTPSRYFRSSEKAPGGPDAQGGVWDWLQSQLPSPARSS